MRLGGFPARTKTLKRTTRGKGLQLGWRKAALAAAHGGGIQLRLRGHLLHRVPQHTGRVGEFFIGEEASLAVAHRQTRLAAHLAVVMKEEQPHITLRCMAVNMDVVTQRVAGHRQATVPSQVATQQAVDALALVEGIDPQPADQQQIGLAGFDHHPGGHAAFAVQVPAVGAHIGLGPQRALAHGAGHCVNAGHAVGQ